MTLKEIKTIDMNPTDFGSEQICDMTEENNKNPGAPKFNRGDLVKYIDGDGRPHQIHKVDWNPGMGRPNDGWWEYTFVDNRTAQQEFELVPFVDENLLNQVCEWIYEHHGDIKYAEYDSEFGIVPFRITDFINDLKEYIQNGSKE